MRLRPVFLILVFFLYLHPLAYAQQVVIHGVAKGAEGKRIVLKMYSDFIAQEETNLATTFIDSVARFKLQCTIPEASLVFFQIEYYSGEMYLEPNKSYDIELTNLIFNEQNDKTNYNLNPFTCFVRVKSDKPDDLNQLIQQFNVQYNKYLRTHYHLLTNREIFHSIDSLQKSIDEQFNRYSASFLKNYIDYRMASLQMISRKTSMTKLGENYLLNKPIIYGNVEYMEFFNDYLDLYFSDLTRVVHLTDFHTVVNDNKNLLEALNILGQDTLFKNEIFRELVLLKSLDIMHSSTGFNKKGIIEVLQQIAIKSKTEKHRLMANNLMVSYKKFSRGSEAPEFRLLDTNDSLVRLSDYRGKLVVICFFTTWCQPCLNELDLMKKMYEKYYPEVHFISISADRELVKAFYLKNEKKYPWTFLHFGTDYELLQQYGVLSYPTFVLLDTKGNFYECPASLPSESLDLSIQNLIKQKVKSKE